MPICDVLLNFLVSAYISPKGCKEDEVGMTYSGEINTTETGQTCQHWGSQTPHKHGYGFLSEEGNYCRNPQFSKRPWCFTWSPTKRNVTWDFCDIPICSE